MKKSNFLVGVAATLLLVGIVNGQDRPRPAATTPKPSPTPAPPFNMDRYFGNMEEDVAVYDPASPFIYDGKESWRKRVVQMRKIREFTDLNQFNRTEVELGNMRVVTVDREIRRPEGSYTERLHGRITWVYLKQPNGDWWVWHDHTSEIPEDYAYRK